MHKLSKYVWHAKGESRPLGRENLFSKKKYLKQPLFCEQIGITSLWTWRTNYRLQVNLWATPENFGVQRFKLAMCKVGGINIEAAVGRKKFVPNWNGNSQKNWIFLLLGLQLKNEER